MLDIRNISKTFVGKEGSVVALDNVSMSINQGEIFGIIGLSGAGKSTLVRCMNMLTRPDSGSIVVDGQEMTALNPKQLNAKRKQIAMIFQSFNLFAQRNVLDNVMFPLIGGGLSRRQAKERALELLAEVSLTDKIDSYPAQLSGGQKQRVAIARALSTNPKILLCDEATSALDNMTTHNILALLKEINSRLGVTIVIITHEMSVVEKICDRVAVMDMSKVVEIDTVERIFTSPQSDIARQLIMPPSDDTLVANYSSDYTIRIVFSGQTYDKPIISTMSIATGVEVNILYANSKTIEGKTYGQLILALPKDKQNQYKITQFLTDNNIHYNISGGESCN